MASELRRTTWMVLLAALGLGSLPACLFKDSACPARKYEAPDERFVFFALGRAEVPADGHYAVGYVAAQLDADPAMHVLIVGHADATGGKGDVHRELSYKRARAVRKVLVDHGVKEARILIAAPKDQAEAATAQHARRADLFVYDPLQDEASKRLGYPVELKSE